MEKKKLCFMLEIWLKINIWNVIKKMYIQNKSSNCILVIEKKVVWKNLHLHKMIILLSIISLVNKGWKRLNWQLKKYQLIEISNGNSK